MNPPLSIAFPAFDLHALQLFRWVVETGSFTNAAKKVGLTQSAVTRQIQSMEALTGVALLERTTRQVRPTPAGRYLLEQSSRIFGEVATTLERLHEEFATAPKCVKISVTRTVGLSYLPGFFAAYQRRFPQVRLQVNHQTSAETLASLEARECDVGILCPPAKLPKTLVAAHRFADDFTAIVPAKMPVSVEFTHPVSPADLTRAFADQRWLLIDRRSNTGQRLRAWMEQTGLTMQTDAVEADSFDLIINLVSLGHGVSLVPHRALPLYLRRRSVRRIALTPKFSRELAVITLKERHPPREHVRHFVESVLF